MCVHSFETYKILWIEVRLIDDILTFLVYHRKDEIV